MLCTIRNPTAGTARVAGFDVVRERDQVRRRIGLVFQQQTLDLQLTAEQNLRFHADLYGLAVPTPSAASTRCSRWWRWPTAARTGDEVLRRHEAPAGDRPRPGARPAGAVPRRAHDRPGPADPGGDLGLPARAPQRTEITVFVTTHYMDEAEHCDRIAIMDHGQIVVEDTPEALKSSIGTDRIAAAHGRRRARDRPDPRAARPRGRRARGAGDDRRPRRSQVVPRLFTELGVQIRDGDRHPAEPRRRLHDLHRPHHL